MTTARAADGLSELRAALRAWYRAHARDLPWRRTRDPYRVWVSEILLQQTRVETALAYYERFVAALPDVAALAAASEERVLKLWEGAGYYARARNLHRAARLVVAQRGGALPRNAAEWAELPGVGPYTSAAIASIAGGEPVATVDGNIRRVLARLFLVRRPVAEPATQAELWRLARRLLDREAPGEFNQALMELGARVCTPRRPRCTECPVARWCAAQAAGLQAAVPVRQRRVATPRVRALAALVRRGGRVLLVRRTRPGLLRGFWTLPAEECRPRERATDVLQRAVRGVLGGRARLVETRLLGAVTHVFTHRMLSVKVYECRVGSVMIAARSAAGVRWVSPGQVGALPLSRLDRKLLAVAGDGSA